MTSPLVTVVLRQKPNADQEDAAVQSLVQNLGVKFKTAQQIVSNIPLRVYNKLSLTEGRILVEALNVSTSLDWELLAENDTQLPSVNWNKEPMINGLSLDDLVQKNDPHKTGVAKLIPALVNEQSSKSAKPKLSLGKKAVARPGTTQSIEPVPKTNEPETRPVTQSSGPDSTIIKTADSVVRHLSMDLAEAYRKNTLPNPTETQSLPAFANDSQNFPGTMKSRLEPGFYNLYLPAINNNETRNKVMQMCQDALNWSSDDIQSNLSKPIVCIARNIDDIDATRLMDRFSQIDILLNCKLRSKI
jgi:hypothetical protein